MYREQGDAPSYRLVREHFETMRACIARHQGAIVKTMGDAVMATFCDPADGLEAALDLLRTPPGDSPGLVIKLGLHSGPAIAVNSGGLLDYFGHTVNLAARHQGQSQGADLMLAAEAAADERLAPLLAAPDVQVERFQAIVRGIDQPIDMLRVRVLPVQAGSGLGGSG